MRFGLCGGADEIAPALAAGFDYVEVPAHSLPDLRKVYAAHPLEVTNLFFPSSVRLFGTDATPYLEPARRVIETAAALGVRVMVLGSGNARRAPEGMSLDEAEHRFVNVATEVAEIGRSHGVTIAPESLNRAETNVGNDLGKLALSLRAKSVAYTADSYQVIAEWARPEPVTVDHWRAQLPFPPAHVHLADRRREIPEPNDPDLAGFASRLRELGYDGRISYEGRRTLDDFPRVLASLQEIFASCH